MIRIDVIDGIDGSSRLRGDPFLRLSVNAESPDKLSVCVDFLICY